jgi:glycosyltransferase involved in cell wall biosynthesis
VDFLGFRPDIERLYRGADLFLLPSLYEHFCRAAHEAASSELPLVATRVGGIADLLDQGAGIPVGRSADSIANALARLAGDPGLRRQMGARGRELCARFRPELWADRYLELYEQLLSATR